MIKFGTGGFRGVIGEDFTKDNVRLVAQALCEIIQEDKSDKPVIIGFDRRFGSDYFARWMAEVFAANKVKVLLYTEPMPSPAVMCAVRDEDADFGIMITASHNPYYFNGVKLFVKGGMDADVTFTDRLERAAEKTSSVSSVTLAQAFSKGLCEEFSNKEKYLDNIKSFINPEIKNNDANVLYDNLWGVGAGCIEPLLKDFGIKNYTVLHKERDAFFNFENPNPTESAMEPLKKTVLDGGYDLAMATDSDSDRLGIVDEKGNYVSSNDILAVLYYYLVKYRGEKGDVVKNCATSVLLDKLAAKFGFVCHETDVGFKNISAKLKETDALIGGESSGGLTVRNYIFGKDSVFASSLFLEAAVLMKKPVSKIIDEVHRFAEYRYIVEEDEIRFDNEDGLIEFLDSRSPEFDRPLRQKTHFNRNFKYCFDDDCWALIRLSGTEPVFRVFVECESQIAAKTNIEILRKFIASRE